MEYATSLLTNSSLQETVRVEKITIVAIVKIYTFHFNIN
jgi:hypothetical protein